jgi:hypothetical protein
MAKKIAEGTNKIRTTLGNLESIMEMSDNRLKE